jgi:hypothetical protein
VLDTLNRKGFPGSIPKNGRDSGTSVYMWEGPTSRVMVAIRAYGKFYDFYSVSPEYLGYTIVCGTINSLYLAHTCSHSNS